MKKRLLSLLLAVLMLCSLLPAAALAAPAEPVTAKVDFTSQMAGAFLHAPQFGMEVSSDLAEKYGYTDQVSGAVSVLDVLVKAHELVFEDDFTAATATEYLTLGASGSPSKQFGTSPEASGLYLGCFFLNHCLSNDGTKYDANNYTGTLVATQAVKDGDLVEFFFYEDPYFGDTYNWFLDDAEDYSRSFSVMQNEELELTLMGFYAMSCSIFKNEAEMIASDKPSEVADAQLYTVDLSSGALTEITGAVTDGDGLVTLKFDKAGTYTIAAYGNDDCSFTQLLSLTTVEVKAPAKPASIKVAPDYKRFVDGTVYGEAGDSFQLFAYDDEGNDISDQVTWSNQYVGTIDPDTGLFTITNALTAGSTSMLYVTAASKADPSLKYETRPAISIAGYKMSDYAKTKTVALSTDGQSAKNSSIGSGGVDGHNIWTYSIPEGVGRLQADPGTGNQIKFDLLRPGVITAGFKVDFDETMTDSGTITVTGVAVEDAAGTQGKTYLSVGEGASATTVQLKAYLMEGRQLHSWTSADEDIAAVDADGLVTAKGVGSVIITATDDQGTAGGIKVVVESAETPYFEALEFLTTAFNSDAWQTGKTFSPTKLEYDLPIRTYSTSSLTMQATTLYDTEKYTATAEYTDINGEKQSVAVNSGKITTLPNQPFDDSVMTVTLADKDDPDHKTVYTFNVHRPRDTTKTIRATTGIVLAPEGRALLATKYNGQAEGVMFKADDTGTPTSGTGVTAAQYNYRTYVQNGLEKFSLSLTGNTAYTHLRYSTDNGASWTYLGQNSGSTGPLSFPAASGANAEVKVIIQVLDDQTYAENEKAGKDGFADASPSVYTVWVEQLPAVPEEELPYILTAETDTGDWYPAFSKESIGNYNIVVPNGTSSLDLRYTVAEGCTVKLGNAVQSPDASGVYTLPLRTTNQTLNISSADGTLTNSYAFKIQAKSRYPGPDRVADYLVINSQHTNAGNGMNPEATLAGSQKSLGNFGGYITYYFENSLTNDPNNKYGIDFYIYGNAFMTGATSQITAESGQVWVSEDGETWYALAGSEHYEDSTIWDYTVTYTKTAAGKTAWTDNQGNANDGTARSGAWPNPSLYYLNDLAKSDTITLSGILLPCSDGSIMGDHTTATYAGETKFGYVDYYPNGSLAADVNPYVASPANSNGLDLAWAVDAKGDPVDVSGKEFHYVKVVTASNIWAGSFNEKSTDVTQVVLTAAQDGAVGKTDAPAGVTISDGTDSKVVNFTEGQQIYEVKLGDMKYIGVSVKDAAADDNIYVNNQRIAHDGTAEGFKVTKEGGEKLIRIIVQNGDKEPVLYLLKLSGDAEESDDLLEAVKVNVSGSSSTAATRDGKTYTLTVGHKIDSVGINPITAYSAQIDGADIQDSYALSYGENSFQILVSAADGRTQSATLKITREAAPNPSGNNITVYFTLLGDESHGENGTVHTYKNDKDELLTWISNASFTVPAECTVLDVFEMALRAESLTWTNAGGNYIAEINGLEEFTNGPNSGWMYLLNDKHSGLGVAEQGLKNGDRIIFHYTDDYTQEQGSEPWGGDTTNPVNVSAAAGGRVTASPSRAAAGQTVTLTVTPDTGKALDKLSIKDRGGRELPVTDKGDGTFTFTMPAGSVTVEAGFKDAEHDCPSKKFINIDQKLWYHEAVDYAISHGLMKGTSENTFEPQGTLDRAMIFTLLYRLEGEPAVSGASPFSDVPAGEWYTDAAIWAKAQGLLLGYGDGRCGPQDPITREQMATILLRYAEFKKYDVTKRADLSAYTDADLVSDWALEGVRWANAEDLMTGRTATTLVPGGTATRAEAAAILMRFCENIAK